MNNKEEKCNPIASKHNTHIIGNARFQWMTPQLIRLEWHPQGQFEDRATLAAVNRSFPDVKVTIKHTGNTVIMKSAGLEVAFKDDNKPFNRSNLKIEFTTAGKKTVWNPGKKSTGNLGGTVRTLDNVDGDKALRFIDNPHYREGAEGDEGKKRIIIRCTEDLGTGLVSRDGWAVVDDSTNNVFTDNGWAGARPEGERQDWYFLGYGHNYKAALRDGARVFGSQPLPPRYAFGYWWSKYWAYTDTDLEKLVDSFDENGVPIDVLVIDMDWHLPGWTGDTWDRTYFPDPDEFLARMKEKGLHVTLNLHPADGVGKHEEQFKAMCKAMGMDPARTKAVPFDCTDPEYMKNYFKLLRHPDEKRGVDFWWMDWQQGKKTNIPGLDPLPWLNHLHWHDMETNKERGDNRPLIFSRYGGIGAGRYAVGFSGDTWSNWDSLKYQPYFTATASNVLYGYWSHDLGGHMGGEKNPELYTRWMQFGLYTPVMRTHSSKDPKLERRVWEMPEPYNDLLKDVIRKRYELVPYIYTECMKTHETGQSLVRPMYYEYPEAPDAYTARNQYLFGDKMLVAPVIDPVDGSETAEVKVWLPAGDWYDTARGMMEKGKKDRWITRRYLLSETPVFVRPGTVIPGQRKAARLGGTSIEHLQLTVYPGTEGTYELYEDDGTSRSYGSGNGAVIPVAHTLKNGRHIITVKAARGSYQGFITKKDLTIVLPGTLPPKAVKVGNRNVGWSHRAQPGTWHYDGNRAATVITLQGIDVSTATTVTVAGSAGTVLDGTAGIMARLERVSQYKKMASYHLVLTKDERLGTVLAQAGNRMSRKPETVRAELQSLKKGLQRLPRAIREFRDARPSEARVKYCNMAAALAEQVVEMLKSR